MEYSILYEAIEHEVDCWRKDIKEDFKGGDYELCLKKREEEFVLTLSDEQKELFRLYKLANENYNYETEYCLFIKLFRFALLAGMEMQHGNEHDDWHPEI